MDNCFHSIPPEYDPAIDGFSQAVNDRAEISKVMGSIGSTKVYASGNCSLFESPSGGTLDELRQMLV